MFIVPKGVEHKTFAENGCKIMILEPHGAVNKGKDGGVLMAPNDNRI